MKKLYLLAMFVLLFSNCGWTISADLGEIGVGSRPLSLGRAYTASADDASSVFLNPAGMKENNELGIVSMTGKMLDEVSYVSVGLTTPFPLGTLGFGFINAGTTGIPLTTLTRTSSGDVTINQYGVTDYSSSILYFSYARSMMDEKLLLGGSIKLFAQGFSQNTGSLEGGIGTGVDGDFGLKWKVSRAISFGAIVQNFLPTTWGGKFIWKNGFEESISAVSRIGTSIKIFGDDGLRSYRDQKLLLNLDSEFSPMEKKPGVWHAGLEWWTNPVLALRCGLDQKIRASDSGIGIDNNLTAGVGFKYKGFGFDYAYHQFGELTENAAHFFSISYIGEKAEKTVKEEIKKKIEQFTTELKEAKGLKKFSDVPDDYWAKDAIEYLATLRIMTGYPDDTFKPEQPLTRAELAALLVKAKGFEVSPPQTALFPDLTNDHWAAPYIDMAMKRKYISGYPDGKFRPWKEVSKAEAVVVIAKFAGLTEPLTVDSNPFPDIKKSHWAARSITVAKQSGLLEYLSGSNFEADKPFTRAEAAEVLSKTDFAKDKIKELLKR